MTAALEATAIRAGYRGAEVLHGFDLHVDRGEIVGLFGANGAGKTTALYALAGILPLSSGSVAWDGDSRAVPPHKRARQGLTLVPERSVFLQLTVAANLRLSRGDPSMSLELFPELRPLLSRRAGLLSGGEQQMLCLARALVGNPSVLLIDELSAGLAPIVVSRLLSATRQAAESGVGVLLVEQQVERALAVVHRGYVLRRGELIMEGTSGELRRRMDLIRSSYLALSERNSDTI